MTKASDTNQDSTPIPNAQANTEPSENTPTEAQASDIGTTREALKVPAFRRLLTAWTLSNLGDSALFLTVAIWIKTMTDNDVYTALIFVAIGLPALAAPVFGMMADRFSRIRLVALSNILVALSILLLFTVHDAQDMWIVYLVMVLYSCTTYINSASQSGLLRDTLELRLLGPANGLFTSIDHGFRIVVPLVAAGAFALWGIQLILIFTIIMFVLGAVFLKFVGITETANDVRFDNTWIKTSLRGFPEVYARKRLWSFLIALVVVVTAGGAINALIFPVLDQGLGLQPEALPIFTSLQGAAAVTAGLMGAALMRRFGFERLMILGLVLFTLGYVAFAVPNIGAVLFASVALGFCMPIMAMVVMTIKQTELPMEVQGRSGAAMNMMLNAPQVLSSALVAVLIGITPYWAILVVGAIFSAFSLVPILRQKRRGEAAGTGESSAI